MNFEEWMREHGKKCPQCGSWRLSTMNNEHPLRHRCLDCGHQCFDNEVQYNGKNCPNRTQRREKPAV